MRIIEKGLARIGIGGFYRRTTGVGLGLREELKGPYSTEGRANPYGDARLPFPLSVRAEFHVRKPKDAVGPDPIELEEIK